MEVKIGIITLVEDRWSLQRIGDRFGRTKITVNGVVKKWRREQTVERKMGTGQE